MGNSCDKVHIDDPPPYISDLQRLSRLDSIQLSNIKSNHPDFNLAQSILKHGRSLECDKDLMSIKEILELIPGTK